MKTNQCWAGKHGQALYGIVNRSACFSPFLSQSQLNLWQGTPVTMITIGNRADHPKKNLSLAFMNKRKPQLFNIHSDLFLNGF